MVEPSGSARPAWVPQPPDACSIDGSVQANFTCSMPTHRIVSPSAVWVDGDDAYEVHMRNPLPQSDARAVCIARGGDLASVHSAAVFDNITVMWSRLSAEQLGSVVTMGQIAGGMLGGVAISNGRTIKDWRWLDGSPLDWAQWRITEPPRAEPLYPEGTQTCLGWGVYGGERLLCPCLQGPVHVRVG